VAQVSEVLAKHQERTLVLIKPDAVIRGIGMEVLSRFERAGLRIAALKLHLATRQMAEQHYTYEDIAARHGERVRELLLEYITEGPVIAAVLQGVSAISVVRKLSGDTEPKKSPAGTIRGDYAHVSYGFCDDAGLAVRNIIHASSSLEDAEREINLWFSPAEVYGTSSSGSNSKSGD